VADDGDGAIATLIRLAIHEDRRRLGQWQAVADDCLTAILRILRRANMQAEDPFVARVEACLHDAIGDHAFRLSDLAQDLGLSNDHMARRYRNLTGMSPRTRLSSLRMAEARALLARGLGVAETAHLVGFGDAFWFSRQFHQHFGMAPRTTRPR
jgi:transcriptional regulator GlxA family with amidase domain